jgi:hypothetical protein
MDQMLKTSRDPTPPPPVLAMRANFEPISGVVFVKLPPGATILAATEPFAIAALAEGPGFISLTEARQLPIGTQVDARAGSLQITTATTAGKHIPKTQTGTFQGGLFQLQQTNQQTLKGLTVLKLLDTGLFPGAPSYAQCATARKAGDPAARTATLSRTVLQTLHSSVHGKFRTNGRYSAATVRGTVWDTVDRCDGTLTVVHRGTVVVSDLRLHKNITLHAGKQYLAKAH